MVASCLLLAAAFGKAAEPPKFRATFVKHTVPQGADVYLLDARSDLSVIGFSRTDMLDASYQYRLWVEKGKHFDKAETFWPYEYSDETSVIGLIGEECPFVKGDDGLTTLLQFSMSNGRFKAINKVFEKPNRRNSPQFKEFLKFKEFDLSWLKKRELDEVDKSIEIEFSAWIMEVGGARIVSVQYYPSSLHTRMPGGIRSILLVETQKGFVRLEECVAGVKQLKLRKTLWIDSSGWMIADAHKGEVHGLVWLSPVQK